MQDFLILISLNKTFGLDLLITVTNRTGPRIPKNFKAYKNPKIFKV